VESVRRLLVVFGRVGNTTGATLEGGVSDSGGGLSLTERYSCLANSMVSVPGDGGNPGLAVGTIESSPLRKKNDRTDYRNIRIGRDR
jgi:hypothetical protein